MDNDDITPTVKRYKQNDNQTTISYNAIDYNSPQQSFAKYLMATSSDSSQSLTRTNPTTKTAVDAESLEDMFDDDTDPGDQATTTMADMAV